MALQFLELLLAKEVFSHIIEQMLGLPQTLQDNYVQTLTSVPPIQFRINCKTAVFIHVFSEKSASILQSM